jgi:polysaccharide biosynthesis/export protein
MSSVQFSRGLIRVLRHLLASGVIATATATLSGAEDPPAPVAAESDAQKLLEGDDIKISFPGAPNLDTVQKIRADGMISIPLLGETKAAGLTTQELQKALAALYAKELVSNEVIVAVVASTYPVYISGAVLNPGEVRCDRPTTVLEAIMKAGGFDPQRARIDKVLVIRRGEKSREINLKAVLQGKAEDDFFVKPSDKIMVPDKAIWF